MSDSLKLLGIGNPLLDISAHVPESYLEKYGLKLNNAILAEDAHKPMYKELVEDFAVEYIAGGATQNTLRVAQWVLNKPGSTAYVGCIGKDAFGEQLKKAARGDGVDVHYLEDEAVPTGTCAVLVHGGERSLVANLSAANCYKADHVRSAEIDALVRATSHIYIAGFFLTVSPETIQHVASIAAESNKVFAMNLSAPFLVEFFREPMMAALPFWDYIFGNESEAAKFGEVHGLGSDLREIALALAKMPKANASRPRTVVFTQGSQSTIAVVGDVVTEFPVDPLPKELLVDTNGAGDAFVGGFLARLIDGGDLTASVEAGHIAARAIIQQSGCTFPAERPAGL